MAGFFFLFCRFWQLWERRKPPRRPAGPSPWVGGTPSTTAPFPSAVLPLPFGNHRDPFSVSCHRRWTPPSSLSLSPSLFIFSLSLSIVPPPLFCPTPPVLLPPSSSSCSAGSKGFPRLVVEGAGGAMSAATQLMFRNMAALLYRGVPRAWASPAGSSSRVPDPPDAADEEEAAAAVGGSEGEEEEEEGVVSEEKAEELEWLEEEAMAGAWEGREPGDYDRWAHLFDESSRVFRALKQREQGHRHPRVKGS